MAVRSSGEATTAVAARRLTRRTCPWQPAAAIKPPFSPVGCRRIGTEHEKLGYNVADSRRLTYEQIAALLTRIQASEGRHAAAACLLYPPGLDMECMRGGPGFSVVASWQACSSCCMLDPTE